MGRSVKRSRKQQVIADWADPDTELTRHVVEQSQRCLEAYAVNPLLVRQDANIERATAQGGYGHRQIYELVQNGADALIDRHPGRIHVLLTDKALYCANEGEPIDEAGADAILTSHMSMKRGTEIGRFGLGFKSVLGVTGEPTFFSRPGSFAFDARRAESRIRAVVPNAERIPTLRLADPISAISEAEQDEDLAALMEWAVTVVRLPRDPAATGWLSDDIASFPAEFLLFSPHVSTLTLEDRSNALAREITLKRSGPNYRLEEDGRTSEWRVLSIQHRPTDGAREDAGELSGRDTIPLIWAVPRKGGRTGRGRFWAFFPTEYVMTLSGILNAPWKTNEDRQNLLPGPFNDELLEVAATLVNETIPDLVQKKDPARFLDTFPARVDESPNWADTKLGEFIYAIASSRPSLPNQRGELTLPADLRIHPSTVTRGSPMLREWLEAWSSCPSRPINWCHPSVQTRERRSRAERLLANAPGSTATFQEWLEALVQDRSPASSIAALRLAARIIKDDPATRAEVEAAQIVLTEDRELVAPSNGAIHLRGEYDPVGLDVTFVHPHVARASEVKKALGNLGITPVDAMSELKAILQDGTHRWDSDRWSMFWDLLQGVNQTAAAEIVQEQLQDPARLIRVRTMAGEFTPLGGCLLPGRVVPADGSRDAAVTVDLGYHRGHSQFLAALGMSDGPQQSGGSDSEGWFLGYRQEMIAHYYRDLPEQLSRPRENLLRFKTEAFPGPLLPLSELSVEGRARFTAVALELAAEAATTWRLQHSSAAKYPIRECEAPWIWRLRNHGALTTSLGDLEVDYCVSSDLAAWSQFLPVSEVERVAAEWLDLPTCIEEMTSEQWSVGLASIDGTEDEESMGRFFGLAAQHAAAPTDIVCRVGTRFESRSPAEVTVVTTRRELTALKADSVPTIICTDEASAAALVDGWGLLPAAQVVRTEIRPVPSGDPVPLIDEFPSLRHLVEESRYSTLLVRCEDLELQTVTSAGRTSEPRTYAFNEASLYWLDGQDDLELLCRLSEEWALGLSRSDCGKLLQQRSKQRARDRIVKIRQQPDLVSRLLATIDADQIRRRLPATLLATVEDAAGPPSNDELARLALAAFGVDVLKAFKDELDTNGLDAPGQWSGSTAARTFVRDLGFPPEFAGFRQARRPPTEEVDGPADLPPLHGFQAAIAENARKVIRGEGGSRGLLSMPTGAGKTRVAVEALIDAYAAGELSGPILWVAQSDELCEQAVQTWAYVWRAIGPGRLAVSRLWAQNEAVPVGHDAGLHLVVATVHKLQGCIGEDGYDWLSEAGCVVIDEAHSSTERMYTALLKWLGLSRGKDRCPLLGLTATPFRGTSEEETTRLVNRYGKRRLDLGVLSDDPYLELQRLGVLATVRHEVLSGSDINLTAEELDHLREFRQLPKSVEERLGANHARNEVLTTSIAALPDDWTVLLFATSVDHAETLAALLTLDGIPSAAISGTTEPGARRHYIDEFRKGRLRVLTNYNVLTQGFDAPAVKAVYVARPTYSPNAYQQMIGRGLRGPINGGTDECLIVNVADNVSQYGEELAFRQFEYLWTSI